MISLNEQQEVFTFINHEIQVKSQQLYSAITQNGSILEQLTLNDIQNKGIVSNQIYFVKEGYISVEYENKELYLYENGDMIAHPSIEDFEESGLYYSAKSEVSIQRISFDDFYEFLASNENAMKLWFSISALNQLQISQMVGALTQKEERANPGFMRYKAGMTIINEGDDAEYVYSISEGVAAAMHKGVEVGVISKDEIFGAIAVLTEQKRTASVVAKTACTVLMVHKDEFSKMVHSHPKLFLNILTSLASKIASLNKKVSEELT